MGIKAKYTEKELFEEFDDSFSKLKKDLINKFFSLGKRAVDIAVADGNYINRSGILRSSIGCGISFNGVLLKEYGFFSIMQEGDSGAILGRNLLYSKIKTNVKINQLRLVIVAGAEYASFLEESDSYTVFSGGIDFVEENLVSILKQLKVIPNE